MDGTAGGGLANSGEVPSRTGAAQVGHDHAGVATLFGQVEARQFLIGVCIDDAAVGAAYLIEVLPGERVHGEHQVFDIAGQALKIDADGFVVAVTFAGAVIAGMDDVTAVGL